jgi:aerobic C4-dicarboxylate transport protein
MPRFYTTLYFRVLVAIAIGIALGIFVPDFAVELKPLSDGFIKLVKMTIAPVIFCTVITGIAGMKQMKAVGKAGGLAIGYFEVLSTLALVVGLVVINVVKPGAGANIVLEKPSAEVAGYIAQGQHQTVVDHIMKIIPESFLGGLANGELLQVLLAAILFGFALHKLGERGAPVLDLIDRIGHVMFDVVGFVMQVAPLGALGAMAVTVGKYGAGTLLSLGQLMACFYATCLLFIFGVLGTIARLHGFSIFKFVRFIRQELLIVLGTSSSESVLPRLMTKLESAGAAKSVVSLVIPAGYSFNLDGTSIYLTMAAVFLAQATNTPMDIWDQLALLGVLLLTSKGAAGVTGSGFIVLAATLSSVGDIPVAALGAIYGIDRFMSEARALTNVIGNGVATVVVAKWCGELDEAQLQQSLTRRA